MSEENKTKKENKFLSFLKKHFSKIWKVIIGVFLGFLGIAVYKKVDSVVMINDNKKKEEIKNNIQETKDSLNTSKETTAEIKQEVVKIKEELDKHVEEVKNINKGYVETQQELAKNAGFKKK